MSPSHHEGAQHWHDRAHGALTHALAMRDEQLRWHLLQVAVGCDRLAECVEKMPIRVSIPKLMPLLLE